MYHRLVPVTKDRHARTMVRRIDSYAFAAGFQLATVTAHEFMRSATAYPLVFIGDEAGDGPKPVALLGLEPGENLFVDQSGRWQAGYIPAVVRRYPFALSATAQADQFAICIDEGSPLVGDVEGEPLFDQGGNPTEVLENVKQYLAELHQLDVRTGEFCRFLREHGLFSPLKMTVTRGTESRTITGSHVVNEERLAGLPDEVFLELRRRNYLPAIHAHLVSLGHIERLATLKASRAADSA